MKIIFIAEVSNKIGIGHFRRSLSLIDFFISKKIKVSFYILNENTKLNYIFLKKISKVKYQLINLPSLKKLIDVNGKNFYIVDLNNYHDEILRSIIKSESYSFFLDYFNYKLNKLPSKIFNLIDHNKSSGKLKIQKELIKKHIILQGPKYSIIKNSLIRLKKKSKFIVKRNIENITISFGGSDPSNNLDKIINKLDQFPHAKKINVFASQLNKKNLKINLSLVNPHNDFKSFDKVLVNSDLLICGGGTTLLEGMYIGVPTIVLFQNKKEENHSTYYSRLNACLINDRLNYKIINKKSFRNQLSINSQKIIDGEGIKRIFNQYQQFINEKKVLFVGAGFAQLESIKICKKNGYEIYCMDQNPQAAGFQYSNYSFVKDLNDYKNIIEIAKTYNISFILCISNDTSLLSYAKACSILGIRTLSIENAILSKNKIKQRNIISKTNLKYPNYFIINKKTKVKKFNKKDLYPLVIKPIDSSGSRGVYYVKNYENLKNFSKKSLNYSNARKCLLEKFIDGVEYAIDGFVINNKVYILCISEKTRSNYPYLLDTEVLFPSKSPFKILSKIELHSKKIIQNFNFNNCPFHIEIIWNKNNPYLVEAAARGPGFKVFTEILPKISGVNTTDVLLDIQKKKVVKINSKSKNKIKILLLFLEPLDLINFNETKKNQITKLQNVSEINIYNSKIYRKKLTKGEDRAGHIIITSKTYSDIEYTKSMILNIIK
jgi:spore coat polysaccharide biosynthesis predicted glycosyltransferase SpsG/biotin carboxylase